MCLVDFAGRFLHFFEVDSMPGLDGQLSRGVIHVQSDWDGWTNGTDSRRQRRGIAYLLCLRARLEKPQLLLETSDVISS